MSVSLLALGESAGGDGYIHSTFLNISGQIIIPADVDVILMAIGGGGSGGRADGVHGGGGGGGFTFKKHKFTSTTTLTGTVGAGGKYEYQPDTTNNGGTTQIIGTGINMIANGGAGAAVRPNNAAGGTASGGDTNLTGAAGVATTSRYNGSGGPRFYEHYPTTGTSNLSWLGYIYNGGSNPNLNYTALYNHSPFGLFNLGENQNTSFDGLAGRGVGGGAEYSQSGGNGIIIALWKNPQ